MVASSRSMTSAARTRASTTQRQRYGLPAPVSGDAGAVMVVDIPATPWRRTPFACRTSFVTDERSSTWRTLFVSSTLFVMAIPAPPWQRQPKARPVRQPLSQELIVDAALGVLQREGLDAVT